MFPAWFQIKRRGTLCVPTQQHKGSHYDDRSIKCEHAAALNYSLVTCNSYLVVVGVGHIEQALFRSPGNTERMLQLGVNPLPIYIPESKKVLVQRRQKGSEEIK